MVRSWYPPGVKTAADRLRYYATQFDTVEVDSTFYGLPSPANARLWAERTPPGFMFHIKAFAMLTRHGIKPEQLPPLIREQHSFELDRSGRVVHPSPELRSQVFALFAEALDPLRTQGKLGLILMQFPPYFVANEANRGYIVKAARSSRSRQDGRGIPPFVLGGPRRAGDALWICSVLTISPTCAWTSPG